MVTATFLILAVAVIVSAAVVVLHKSPVISALALAANLVCMAGFYLLLHAQFLALLQVIVYAGAIMVLVLFVVMLLNLQDEERVKGRGVIQLWLGLGLAAAFALMLARVFIGEFGGASFPELGRGFGNVSTLGMSLFREFFYAFEAISLLLLVAMIGAVVLAKRRV